MLPIVCLLRTLAAAAHNTSATEYHTLPPVELIGELVDRESISAAQIIASGIPVDPAQAAYERHLIKLGNRELNGSDFSWVLSDFISERRYPEQLVTLERREWGNFYGFLAGLKEKRVLL